MLASMVRGIVRETPEWAKHFPLHTEVAVQETEGGDDPAWGIVTGYAEGYEYPVEERLPWPYDPKTTYYKREGRFISVQLYDGVEVLVPFESVAAWEPPARKENLFALLLCALGLHDWEEKVSKRGLVRTTNWFGGWLIDQDQDGLQCCNRGGCPAKRKVARSGLLCTDKKEIRWHPVRE